MCWHPGPLDSLVCGHHQCDGNHTLDIYAQPRVWLPPLFVRRVDNLFRVAPASTPSIPSTEATKGGKCWHCRRQDSRYIFFFALYTSWRHFSRFFTKWDLASVFTKRMSLTLLVPFCQKSRIRRPPFCSVTSGLFFDSGWLDPDSCTFFLYTLRPVKMRGSSRMSVRVKDFRSKFATPLQSSLWCSVTRLSFL